MPSIAILGAGGFIGSRLIEMLHLERSAEVRPIVRRVGGLASISRFDLEYRIADALDSRALIQALKGCEFLINAVKGDDETIEATVEPIYRAAQAAGVRRIVYLSTASVHGQAPARGTTEDSALSDRQPVSYNNAKVRAERHFQRLRKTGAVELVVLRPAIVYGPRSYWIDGFAEALLDERAYVVNHARGVCNAIYVDNLVRAIYKSLFERKADREALLLVDDEVVTWADLWRPIAHALGIELAELPNLSFPRSHRRWSEVAAKLPLRRPIAAALPAPFKGAIKGFVAGWNQQSQPSRWQRSPKPVVAASEEIAHLHHCAYKLPNKKALHIIGPYQNISFDEGCRRSIGWLSFAGYPISDATA